MFSARLRSTRKSIGLSQKELAEKIGVKPTTLGNWETGIATPRTEELKKLASVLGVSIDYLLGMVDDPNGRIELNDISKMLDENEDVFWKNQKLSPNQVEKVKEFIEFVLSRKGQK